MSKVKEKRMSYLVLAYQRFLNRLIDLGYFSRVKKVEFKGKEEKETEAAATKKAGGKKKEAGNVSPRAKDTDRDEDGKKKKKKFRLQPHEHQKFVDSSEDVRYFVSEITSQLMSPIFYKCKHSIRTLTLLRIIYSTIT